MPGGAVVEVGKVKFGFLAGDCGEVFGDGHGARVSGWRDGCRQRQGQRQ
jgi:hypothetical protein